ncbi:MAG: hypothetical protein ABIE03_05525 [Patescibacteria group bacterium]|nr:hypothetical protein [Patescibacteria group bacterium]
MKAIEYIMSISKETEAEFLKYVKEVLGPTWKKLGCQKHEIYKVTDKAIVGRQIVEQDRFIERLYFGDDFDISRFYSEARKKYLEVVRSYEDMFGVYQIELRILKEVT